MPSSGVEFLVHFPDICFGSYIRLFDVSVVYAETLLHSLYKALVNRQSLTLIMPLFLEVFYITAAQDPTYKICRALMSGLLKMSSYFSDYLLINMDFFPFFIFQALEVFFNYVIEYYVVMHRCYMVGFVREMWEIQFKLIGFPNPMLMVEKTALFIFVRYFLWAPPSLICVFWTLKIAHEYVCNYQCKTCEDILLIPTILLLTIGMVEWWKSYYLLSISYMYFSYLVYIYWLYSKKLHGFSNFSSLLIGLCDHEDSNNSLSR